MQILHPFSGSVEQYLDQLSDPDQYRPSHCPQCQAKQPLIAHGFYTRTIADATFDGSISVRRYLCDTCRRTVSLLPEFALPYLRSSIAVIALFLIARLLDAQTLKAALPPASPYQRGQFWVRRFRAQAATLAASLAALTKPAPAADFIHRTLAMLQSAGWIPAHRFLFGALRQHLLGWSRRLRSRWPPRRTGPRRRARLRLPTNHLHGSARLSPVHLGPGEKLTPWTTKLKKSRCSVMD